MTHDFEKNKHLIDQFFYDGEKFRIDKKSNSYYQSYPEFLKYFSDLEDEIKKHHLIIGIHFVYGWMPTIFDFRSEKFEEAIKILNEAKKGNDINVDDLKLLKGLFNNSLVGTSKLLHFINPEKFAIWDSRVCRYLTKKEPHEYRVSDCKAYLEYLQFCGYLIKQDRFKSLKEHLEKQIGYPMTAFRVAELVMFSNGEKTDKP